MASSSTTTSPSPSLSEATSIRPIACNPCRHRRSQCSKERPKCKRCREGGIDCIYEEARKINVNESYLRDLESKAKAYEEALKNRRLHVSPAVPIKGKAPVGSNSGNNSGSNSGSGSGSGNGHDNGGYYDDDDEIAEGNALLEDFGRLGVGGVGEQEPRPSTSLKGGFKGPGHSDMFLRSMGKLPGVHYPDDVSLDFNPRYYDPELLTPRRLSTRSHIRLPPIDTARRYYAAQYTYIGTIFSWTEPAKFEQSLIEAYQGPLPDLNDQEACLKYAKILVILAFGQLYSVNQWIDFKGPPGFEYFMHALQLLPDVHEEGSILCVETLSLIGYFMQNMNRRDAAFLYIGMALRMAISLGLHQEVSDQSMDEEVREHRRRVWWSIYSLDRILCVKSGNPITIQDEDIGVKPPSKLPSEPDYCPAVVLRQYTELSRILGEVNKYIFRKVPKSGARLMASVKSIMLALSRWHRELPEQLRFDPARLSISRESVSTLVHYYQCINMTARPLLFHVVQKRLLGGSGCGGPGEKERPSWKEGLSQTTISVIEMCVSAAQDSIKLMSIAAQRDLVATYGYMDSEHIFSATIVLVMVCIAFPPDPQNTQAMNAGLVLLRGMSERGNSYIGARYQLLDHLRTIVVPSPPPMAQQPQAMQPAPSLAPSVPSGGFSTMTAATSTTASSSPAQPQYPTPHSPQGSFSGPSQHQQQQHEQHPRRHQQQQHQRQQRILQASPSPSTVVPNTGMLGQRTLVFGPIPVAAGGAYAPDTIAAHETLDFGFGAAQYNGSNNTFGPTTTSPSSSTSANHHTSPNSNNNNNNPYASPTNNSIVNNMSFFNVPGGLRLLDGDVASVEEIFFDVNMSNGLAGAGEDGADGDDFGLWEAGFADPSAAYDLAQLTQMAVDHGHSHAHSHAHSHSHGHGQVLGGGGEGDEDGLGGGGMGMNLDL